MASKGPGPLPMMRAGALAHDWGRSNNGLSTRYVPTARGGNASPYAQYCAYAQGAETPFASGTHTGREAGARSPYVLPCVGPGVIASVRVEVLEGTTEI